MKNDKLHFQMMVKAAAQSVMRSACILIPGLLIGGQGLAVDEDYEIPYTDTYGYVYDSETGQYVKAEPPEGQEVSPSHEPSATSNSDRPSNQGVPDHLIMVMISTMALGAVGFYFWLRLRKASM